MVKVVRRVAEVEAAVASTSSAVRQLQAQIAGSVSSGRHRKSTSLKVGSGKREGVRDGVEPKKKRRSRESMSELERKKQKLESEIERQKSELARLSTLTDKKTSSSVVQAYPKVQEGVPPYGVVPVQPGSASFVAIPGQQPMLYPGSGSYVPVAYYTGAPVSSVDSTNQRVPAQQGWQGVAGGYVGMPNQSVSGQAPSYTVQQSQATKDEKGAATKSKRKQLREDTPDRSLNDAAGKTRLKAKTKGGEAKKSGAVVKQAKDSSTSLVLKNLNIRPNSLLVRISTNQHISIMGKKLPLFSHGYIVNNTFIPAYNTVEMESEQKKGEEKAQLSKAELHRLHYVQSIKSAPALPEAKQSPKRKRQAAGTLQSKYRGVSWDKNMKAWRTKINSVHIGYFDDENDAARAYDEAALALRGTKATILNFPRKNYDDNGSTENWMKYESKRNVLSRGTSKYRGVLWDRSSASWRAKIKSHGKTKYLGVYADEETAARAYDVAAMRLHGEKAKLNFPEEHPDMLVQVDKESSVGAGQKVLKAKEATSSGSSRKAPAVNKGRGGQCIPKDADISAQHEMMSLLHKVRKKKSEQKGEKADKPKVQLSDKINDQESTAFLEAVEKLSSPMKHPTVKSSPASTKEKGKDISHLKHLMSTLEGKDLEDVAKFIERKAGAMRHK